MSKNKVINLEEYRIKKAKEKAKNTHRINKLKNKEDDDRRDTFNLFMRVLSTIREESY